MTPEQFCYWLQGRAELQPDVPLSDAEWKSVREHLQLVFKKVTPALYGPNTSTPVRHPLDMIGKQFEYPNPMFEPRTTCIAGSAELAKAAIC